MRGPNTSSLVCLRYYRPQFITRRILRRRWKPDSKHHLFLHFLDITVLEEYNSADKSGPFPARRSRSRYAQLYSVLGLSNFSLLGNLRFPAYQLSGAKSPTSFGLRNRSATATFEVKSGKHSVQVVLDGYQDWVQEVSVNAGQVINVTANLEAVGAGQSEKQIVNVAPAHMPATLSPTPIFPDSSTVRKSQGKNEGAKPEPATGAVASGGRGDIGITAVPGTYGVIITELAPDGPAQQAGLKIGDTIIGINDKSIKTVGMIEAATSSRPAGSKMNLSYIRNGISAETTVTVRGLR